MKAVLVVVGAGFIGQAIARRVGAGKHLLLANVTRDSAVEAAEALANAGFDVSAAEVDISSRASVQTLIDRAQALGSITGLVQAAGVSPSQATIETIRSRASTLLKASAC